MDIYHDETVIDHHRLTVYPSYLSEGVGEIDDSSRKPMNHSDFPEKQDLDWGFAQSYPPDKVIVNHVTAIKHHEIQQPQLLCSLPNLEHQAKTFTYTVREYLRDLMKDFVCGPVDTAQDIDRCQNAIVAACFLRARIMTLGLEEQDLNDDESLVRGVFEIVQLPLTQSGHITKRSLAHLQAFLIHPLGTAITTERTRTLETAKVHSTALSQTENQPATGLDGASRTTATASTNTSYSEDMQHSFDSNNYAQGYWHPPMAPVHQNSFCHNPRLAQAAEDRMCMFDAHCSCHWCHRSEPLIPQYFGSNNDDGGIIPHAKGPATALVQYDEASNVYDAQLSTGQASTWPSVPMTQPSSLIYQVGPALARDQKAINSSTIPVIARPTSRRRGPPGQILGVQGKTRVARTTRQIKTNRRADAITQQQSGLSQEEKVLNLQPTALTFVNTMPTALQDQQEPEGSEHTSNTDDSRDKRTTTTKQNPVTNMRPAGYRCLMPVDIEGRSRDKLIVGRRAEKIWL